MGSFLKPMRFYEIISFYPKLFHNFFTKFVDDFPALIFSHLREKFLAFPEG